MTHRIIAAVLFASLALFLAAPSDAGDPAQPSRTTVAQAAKTACKQTCEANRQACMKASARANAQGVPVTSPGDTKKCWDSFYVCDKGC